MRFILAVFLALPLAAPPRAEEAPPVVAPAEPAAAVAEILRGAESLEFEDLWDRGDKLRELGPRAGEALRAGLADAGPKAKLILARQMLDIREQQKAGADVLAELAAKAESRDVRIYAANSLGQCTALFGSRPLIADLDKAAEIEKDKLVQVALHRARGRLGNDGAATVALTLMMKENTGAVRKEAALALGELGRASMPEVRRELLLIFRNDPTARADRALSIYRNATAGNALFTEVLRAITSYYDADPAQPTKVETDELVRSAVRGMVSSLDAFSSYMDPQEGQEMTESLTGEYGGIGAYVNLDGGVFTIVSPIYGGPAHKVGLRSMDRVLEVDGIKTTNEPIGKTISRLKGKPGTGVKVKIFRRGWGEPKEFAITREQIKVDSVLPEMLPGKLGYVRLVRFGPKAETELSEALEGLRKEGMRGLILDLRDNPGGFLQSAVSLSDLFLPAEKMIVTSKGRQVQPSEYKSSGKGPYAELPLVVLVNSGSASASEILAGALRDNERATLVGEKTYGKGSVQEPIRLRSEPGSILKLTVAKYYLPKGECIHEKGISPDVEIVSEEHVTPGWKYDELAKVAEDLESYATAAYRKDPEALRGLADDDGGDAAKYPGLAEKVKELQAKAHFSEEDARPYVRRVVRRLAADDRNKRYVANMEDDRQLKRAALALLERLKVAGELPAPYNRYQKVFEEESKRREAQAAGRLGLPQQGE